jgi:hypothetical protein
MQEQHRTTNATVQTRANSETDTRDNNSLGRDIMLRSCAGAAAVTLCALWHSSCTRGQAATVSVALLLPVTTQPQPGS